ncbi:MAG: hypothetical protein AABN34_07460 [Acidobacteriota bacterium]
MSKLTQIETALRAIDPAGFHRLCDSYLHALGHKNINSLGLVTGAEKEKKGTPDTFIAQADGTYVFAEYTTTQEHKKLAAKFEDDLRKCFDEGKTGVPISKIREIVLCHNSTLEPAEDYKLRQICFNQGVIPNFFGLNAIAQDLFQEYPGLALEFLGVNVDSGQILSATEFIFNYNRSALATPLDTTFRFRNDELSSALVALESSDIVLMSGRPGVGKSRLALECCERYEASHPGTVVRCVLPRGRDLFDDLRIHFSERAHYLIFIDDANRVNRFEYALQLLREQSDERSFKIIATVRDYALEKAREIAKDFGPSSLIKLAPLKDDEIKELAREEFGIINDIYLNRIVDIAKGNPRLAIMAASIAKRENTFDSIGDVTALYDEYFASIRHDVEDLDNPSLLLVAGLVAFFRTIDRSNTELVRTITEAFGIDVEDLWACVNKLHKLEAVDMREEEIVRVSDQVLATYLFYLAVFKMRRLDLGILLDRFFPAFAHRMIDMLNSVLSAFDHNAIRENLRPYVDQAWGLFQQRGDDNAVRQLINVFWFVKPTDSLLYLRDAVRALDPEPRPLSELIFAPGTQANPAGSIVGLLDNFWSGDADSRRIALSLIVDYMEKRPSAASAVLRILTEHWGIDYWSHIQKFQREQQVIQVLCERTKGGRNELVSRVLLTIAEHFLRTHFHANEMKDHLTVTIRRFDVRATADLLELRRKLWHCIFDLYSGAHLREPVLDFFLRHSQAAYYVREPDVLRTDAKHVFSFFDRCLDPTNYKHCLAVNRYLTLLTGRGVEVNHATLATTFTNKTYEVSSLLLPDRVEQTAVGWKEYDEVKRNRILKYSAAFDEAAFEQFLNACAEVVDTFRRGSREHFQVHSGISDILMALARRDPQQFEAVFDTYLHSGYCLAGPMRLVNTLIEVRGADRAYDVISRGSYAGRARWLLHYFVAVDHESLTQARLGELYSLYETASAEDLSGAIMHLLEVDDKGEPAIIRVVRILIDRCDSEPAVGVVLSPLFDGRSTESDMLLRLLADDVELLAKSYLAACDAAPGTDYSGDVFDSLLNLDAQFTGRWVSWIIEKDRAFSHDEHRDYSFIWRRDDHASIATRILDRLFAHADGRFDIYSPAEMLFRVGNDTIRKQTLHERQDAFLEDTIRNRNADRALMRLLFRAISGFEDSRRRSCVKTFVSNNTDFDSFVHLPLEPTSWSWEGSAVPYLRKRVGFLRSLIPLMNRIDLLAHRQCIEQRIRGIQAQIEHERKEDFVDY